MQCVSKPPPHRNPKTDTHTETLKETPDGNTSHPNTETLKQTPSNRHTYVLARL